MRIADFFKAIGLAIKSEKSIPKGTSYKYLKATLQVGNKVKIPCFRSYTYGGNQRVTQSDFHYGEVITIHGDYTAVRLKRRRTGEIVRTSELILISESEYKRSS